MLDKQYIQQIREELLSYALKRREVIKVAGDAQQQAKKAIFALQRDDKEGAEERLRLAKEYLDKLNEEFKGQDDLFDEGSYRAALEEYVEASLFYKFFVNEPLGQVKEFAMDADIFIGGLGDVPGELYRYAIKSATEKKFEEVKRCHKIAEEIIGEMVDMDLTGYNRTKFDQAKSSLHKIEDVVYELSLRS